MKRGWIAVAVVPIVAFAWLAPGGFWPADDKENLRLQAFDERPFRDEVMYFLVTDRFSNGDPENDRGGVEGDRDITGYDPESEMYYHGGDLRGVTDKLDYLAEMGITAIWMTPIFGNRWMQEHDGWVTASYHGYWITDFTSVDPHLGTAEDLRELIDEAHRRDIKVFFDIVVNHTADVLQYRQCHDVEYIGSDKQAAGSACLYRPTDEYPYDTRGRADGPQINIGYQGHNVQTDENFARLTDPSYAFEPFVAEEFEQAKAPDWLNDPIHYHNRGELVYSGESFYFGDFYGLDDVFTEHPRVVEGMIDIYQYWIGEFGIDGFRIDTAGHVNTEFFQQFVPAMQGHASEHGRPQFFMFGEVVDDVLKKRLYVTDARLPAVLDFDFQEAISEYVAGTGSASVFADLFLNDDYFIDGDSSPYDLPTFLGNHDLGRFGVYLQQYDPGAAEDVHIRRLQLAYAALYFTRGVPIIYYGDEQGFVGEPGFHESREDMFASAVDKFNDNNLLGTDQTTAVENFDTRHVMYRFLQELGRVYRTHPTLRRGDQHTRYADRGPGIVAFSRIDPDERIEYVIAFNNSDQERTAAIPVSASGDWSVVAGAGSIDTAAQNHIDVAIPPIDYAIFRAADRVVIQETAPVPSFPGLQDGDVLDCAGFVDVVLEELALSHVSFEESTGSDNWVSMGVDTSKPYRVYIDPARYPADSVLRLRATAGGYGQAQSSTSVSLELSQVSGDCE